MAIPTKIKRIGSNPDFHDSTKTRKHASAPPINAKSGVKKNNVGKNVMMNIDIKPAPAEIPMTPASASGLRITACSNAPATDNAAPAKIAIIIRGKRKSLMTAKSAFCSPNNARINSPSPMLTLPVVAEKKIATNSKIVTTAKLMILFVILIPYCSS